MALTEYTTNNEKIYRVEVPGNKLLKSREDYREIDMEKARKPARHKRVSKKGKIFFAGAGIQDKPPVEVKEISLKAFNSATNKAEARKEREYRPFVEKQTTERNRLYSEITKDVEKEGAELMKKLGDALYDFTSKLPYGLSKGNVDIASYGGGLGEFFLGSKDGINRVQSKISFHVKNGGVSYMLRNEKLDAIKGWLSEGNPLEHLARLIGEASNEGFWNVSA